MLICELAFRNCLHPSEKCSESSEGVKNYSCEVVCGSRKYLAVGTETEGDIICNENVRRKWHVGRI